MFNFIIYIQYRLFIRYIVYHTGISQDISPLTVRNRLCQCSQYKTVTYFHFKKRIVTESHINFQSQFKKAQTIYEKS